TCMQATSFAYHTLNTTFGNVQNWTGPGGYGGHTLRDSRIEGNFTYPAQTDTSALHEPIRIDGDGLVAELKNDGHSDTCNAYFYVGRNSGSGFQGSNWQLPCSDKVTDSIHSSELGSTYSDLIDLNGDGRPDSVTQAYSKGLGFGRYVLWNDNG